MIARILTFLLGYALTLIGIIYMISYLNILELGYNFWFYVNFICRRLECIYAIIGITLMVISVYTPGGKNELCL